MKRAACENIPVAKLAKSFGRLVKRKLSVISDQRENEEKLDHCSLITDG
jgi:hypothetical protein